MEPLPRYSCPSLWLLSWCYSSVHSVAKRLWQNKRHTIIILKTIASRNLTHFHTKVSPSPTSDTPNQPTDGMNGNLTAFLPRTADLLRFRVYAVNFIIKFMLGDNVMLSKMKWYEYMKEYGKCKSSCNQVVNCDVIKIECQPPEGEER